MGGGTAKFTGCVCKRTVPADERTVEAGGSADAVIAAWSALWGHGPRCFARRESLEPIAARNGLTLPVGEKPALDFVPMRRDSEK